MGNSFNISHVSLNPVKFCTWKSFYIQEHDEEDSRIQVKHMYSKVVLIRPQGLYVTNINSVLLGLVMKIRYKQLHFLNEYNKISFNWYE